MDKKMIGIVNVNGKKKYPETVWISVYAGPNLNSQKASAIKKYSCTELANKLAVLILYSTRLSRHNTLHPSQYQHS